MANPILRMLRYSQHLRLRKSQGCAKHNTPHPTAIAAMPALGWLTLDVGLALAFGVALGTLITAMMV